ATTLVAFVPAPSSAESQEALRLADVLADAREHNPEIQAARDRASAAAAMPARASAYDDPTFSYEAWNAPSVRIDRADNNIFRLSQRIPFPGKRTLAGTIAERDADVARRDADAVTLDVVHGVKRAYSDLWLEHEQLRVSGREKALVERFARIAEEKYAVGDVSQPDVLQAQLEVTRLSSRVTTQTLAIDVARAELNALLSRPADAPLGTPADEPRPTLDATVDALTELALANRPELAAHATAVAREEAAVRLARRDYYPDFELGVARFINDGQRDGFGGLVSVSIPLANKRKYDAGVDEARAKASAAEAELRRARDRVRRDVEQAFLRARTASLEHELFVRTHIPQAEQALRVTESAYEAGRIDFLRLVDSARAIEMAHLEHLEAAAAFEKAYADLERAVGTSLPRSPATREER